MLLLTGIAWLIISVIVLRFRMTSVATIGVLIGVVFLAAMANEFLIAAVRRRWGWAHVLLGILFLYFHHHTLTGVYALDALDTAAEVARFLDGWDVLPPGIVNGPAWRPGFMAVETRRTRSRTPGSSWASCTHCARLLPPKPL